MSDMSQDYLIASLIVTNVVQLVLHIVNTIGGIMKQRENRADRALELQQLQAAGALREKTIIHAVQEVKSDVREVKAEAAHALKTANGHNEKIQKAVEAVETIAKMPPPTIIVRKDMEVPSSD